MQPQVPRDKKDASNRRGIKDLSFDISNVRWTTINKTVDTHLRVSLPWLLVDSNLIFEASLDDSRGETGSPDLEH